MSPPHGGKARNHDDRTPAPLKGKARTEAENRVIAAARGMAQTSLVLALFRYAAGKSDCWPSNATLARVLKVKPRYVRELLAELAKAGVITLVKEPSLRTQRRIVFNGFGAAGDQAETADDVEEPF